jgi:hypothetical protein
VTQREIDHIMSELRTIRSRVRRLELVLVGAALLILSPEYFDRIATLVR